MPQRYLLSLLALAALALTTCASPNWPAYRFTGLRQGNQLDATALSNPHKVPSLAIRWTFTSPNGDAFYASPIVVKKRVFIGGTSGYFYALNAGTGALVWQFPAPGHPLLGSCAGDFPPQTFGQYGVMSSATWDDGMVIFGAPDPDTGTDGGNGSARLWALRESDGSLIWKSDVVAHVTGCTPGSASELHERIAYSSPLVYGGKVYVGTHDSGDDPIQRGKVVAVDLATGHLVPGFSFEAVSTRGGGVWNSPATDLTGVLFTTGNTRCDAAGCQGTCDAAGNPTGEPAHNHGLSLVKVDPNSGGVHWAFQAVPYCEDYDPDWAAGVAVMSASCGLLAASVQKDGWTYALNDNGSCRWQFPPTAGPSCKFPKGNNMIHYDDDYKRPGAAWNDVLIINTGGEARVADGVGAGYGRLHALNACAPDEKHRVRWLVDVPHASAGSGYSLGAPTVTGGIVYITTDQGHIVALADPLVAPPSGYRCSHIDFTNQHDCNIAGYSWVPIPRVLADVPLDGTSAAGLRNEAAIASGRLYAATQGGHVYMLSP